MTFSSLISGTIPHHNKYNVRPGGLDSVSRVIQHHWASTNMSGEATLADPNRKASVTYLVYNDGTIKGQVPEEFRPWTSGGPAADNTSITIECQDETGAPEWKVSDAALAAIVRLLADIATRHGFGPITSTNYRGHREFAATACPGPFLWNNMQNIRNAVNTGGATPPVAPPVTPPPASIKPNCTALQAAVRTPVDNAWGANTDKNCDAVREASKWGGFDYPWGVAFTQTVVGTTPDGVWGKKSAAAHDATVRAVQDALKSMGFAAGATDGIWGPTTETAYQQARSICHV